MEPPAPDASRSQKLAAVRAYCQAHLQSVLYDEPGEVLFDVAGGKTLTLRAGDIQAIESAADKDTRDPYLRLTLGDGRVLALTVAGIAFPPDFTNTGPLVDLPPVVCFRDYVGLLSRFKHELYGHAFQAPGRSPVQLLMMCIAIVDGARKVGFEVGREERELETHLTELERRARPPAPEEG